MITYKQVLNKGLVKEASTALLRYLTRNAGKLTRREIGRFINVAEATRGWRASKLPRAILQYSTRPADASSYFKQKVVPLLTQELKENKGFSFLPQLQISKPILDKATSIRNTLFGKWKKPNFNGLFQALDKDLRTDNSALYRLIASEKYSSLSPRQQKIINSLFRLSSGTQKPGISRSRKILFSSESPRVARRTHFLYQPDWEPRADTTKAYMSHNIPIDSKYVWRVGNLGEDALAYTKGAELFVSPNYTGVSKNYWNADKNVLFKIYRDKLRYKGKPVTYSYHVGGAINRGSPSEAPFEKAFQGVIDNTSGRFDDIIAQTYVPFNGVLYPIKRPKNTIWNRLYWRDAKRTGHFPEDGPFYSVPWSK